MTRKIGYELFACPQCGAVHRKEAYSSISIYVPDSILKSSFSCSECHQESNRNDFQKVGFLSRYTKEEEALRYARTLYSFGLGPCPPEPLQLNRMQMLKSWINKLIHGRPKPLWHKYPLLK